MTPVVRIADEADLCRRLRERDPKSPPVMPRGGGHLKGRGGTPAAPVSVWDLSALDQIVEYSPEDLVITVGAGCPWPTVQHLLAQNHQWIPVLPFLQTPVTVGSVIAADLRSPFCGLGTTRDYLLGVRFADAGGRMIDGGGKVVKNVAGYSLPRLLIGTLGELGVLTQATFKVLPKPAHWAGVTIPHPNAEEIRHSTAQACGDLAASAVVAWSEGEARGWTAAFCGEAERTAWQTSTALEFSPRAVALEEPEMLRRLFRWEEGVIPLKAPVVWGGALPETLPGLLNSDSSLPGDTMADLFFGHAWWLPPSREVLGRHLPKLRRHFERVGGHLHVDVPPEDTPWETPWGCDPGPLLAFWQNLKSRLDPAGALVGGRLPGGV